MVDVLIVNGFSNKQIIDTQLFDNTYKVFIDNEDYNNEFNPLGWCPGIFKYNIISNKVDYYKFDTNISIISYESSQACLYYSLIDWKGSKAYVQFRKLDCRNFENKEVVTIELEDVKDMDTGNAIFTKFVIYGINNRYAIAALPCSNHKYGQPRFSQLLLLDSMDNKYYNIPERLGKNDSFLRMDNIVVHSFNNQNYILIKTGAILACEKENYWNRNFKRDTFENYFDQFENLFLIDAHSLVKYVKEGTEIPEDNILSSCDFNCAFTNYSFDGKLVKYQKKDFQKVRTEIASFDIISKKKSEIIVDGLYEYLYESNENLYVFETTEDCKKIFDIESKSNIFTTSSSAEQIIYINNEYVFTHILQEGIKHTILSYNLKENTVNKLGEGWFTFDAKQNILTIFC